LNLDDFKNNIEKIAEALQPKALIITDQKIQVTNSLRHKPLSYLHRFGFATFRQTGFLTLLYLVLKSGIKEIDMLGVDLNYSILEMQKSRSDERPISELISMESEVFYEIESRFRFTLKSGIKVNNLNYDSMVKMAQDFSFRYPLIVGQGNFGSIDGDGAAAYRYTEAKMSRIAISNPRTSCTVHPLGPRANCNTMASGSTTNST
jgi:hypothetical protein